MPTFTDIDIPEPETKPKTINPFQKMTRRYIAEVRTWRGVVTQVIHAMTYEREPRIWRTRCDTGLPDGGHMVPVTEPQPDITCKDCLLLSGGEL